MSDVPMKVIAEFDNEAEAETAVSMLREAGIEVLTSRDEASSSVFGQTPYELVGVAVPENQEAEAQRVLSQLETPPEPGWEKEAEHAIDGWVCPGCDTVVPSEETVCPECGSVRGEKPPAEDEEDES